MFTQIFVDIFAQETTVPVSYKSFCLERAISGLYPLKKLPSLDIVSQMIGKTEQHQLLQENVEIYHKFIFLYTRLLPLLQGEYANIAQLEENYQMP